MDPYANPTDEHMQPQGQPQEGQGQAAAQVLEAVPPEVGFLLVDIALHAPEVFHDLLNTPQEELQQVYQMFEQHLQQGEAQEPMPEEQAGQAYM